MPSKKCVNSLSFPLLFFLFFFALDPRHGPKADFGRRAMAGVKMSYSERILIGQQV